MQSVFLLTSGFSLKLFHLIHLLLLYIPMPEISTREGITITGIQKIALPCATVRVTGVFLASLFLMDIRSASSASHPIVFKKSSQFPARLILVLFAKSESPKAIILPNLNLPSLSFPLSSTPASDEPFTGTVVTAAMDKGPLFSLPSSKDASPVSLHFFKSFSAQLFGPVMAS